MVANDKPFRADGNGRTLRPPSTSRLAPATENKPAQLAKNPAGHSTLCSRVIAPPRLTVRSTC